MKATLALIAVIAALLHPVSAAPSLPEYSAADAKKHIGEQAIVVGKVDCIDHGRRHVDVIIGGCDLRKAALWIVVPNEASGPELDPEQIRNVTVAVTGKIESSMGTPRITVKSTTQIQARSALQTNYIGRAYDKETKGDLDGAIEDLNQAIEHQPARRDEACEHLAGLKEKRGDWTGALAAYDRLVSFDPNKSGSYWVRATAKEQHGDFEGAMADFTRAAELRSSGANFIEIGNRRKAHGDLAGAMETYNKAIAMLDGQIAGMQKPSDQLDLLYYYRGYAKELKGEVDAAVADYSQAIATKPSYEACAYSRRGDIKKARGDLAGAIADYQYAVKYAQLDEDKEKLKKAKAEVEREQAPLADSKSVYGDDKATAKLTRSAHGRAASEQHANSDAAAAAESPTALVTRAKLRIRTGDFDGAIADCDRALQLSRGGSKEASGLRIQAMRAKGSSKTAVAQRVKTSSSQEEQPIAPSTESGAASIAAEPSEKLFSPDKRYSVEILRNSEQGLLVRQSGKTFTKISTPVGPADSSFEALWSSDGRYVAINKQRSSRAGGDEMWIVALPSGKVLRQPDDDLWDELDKRESAYGLESAYIDEKHLSETGGKVFLTLTATGWGKSGLRFRLEAWLSEIETFYFFDGTVDPLNLRMINDWKVSQKQAEAAPPQMRLEGAVSKPVSAEVIDIPAVQANLGIKAGNIKVSFSDGHSEILTRTGNCMDPKVSPTGHVGWTQCSGFDRKGYALNQKLIIHLRNGVTNQFKANPDAPFIVGWAFADNDSAVVIQSMSFHGPSSYIRYDLATERKTNEKAGRDDSEPLPEWARPVAQTLPEYSPAAKGRDGDHASLPSAAQQTERVASTTEATSPQSPLAGTNILGSPAEPGIADVTALVEFTGNGSTNKGRLPNGLIFASDGDIYGTAERGGANDYGTIFKMTTVGALTTLIEFAGKAPANSSGMPRATLIEARDGNFYGTTSGGGFGPTGENYLDNGTVFTLSRSGVLTTLVRFSNNGPTNKGRDPYSPLVQGTTGDFYGTTFGGGSGKALPIPSPLGGFGTIYKMSPAGQLTTLYDFSAHLAKGQGGCPWAGLTLGQDGNFYGTTWNGLGVAGTIFKLTPTGAMTTLVRFGLKPPYKKGGGCEVELLQASDGNFYGTSPTGSPGGGGTVFKMTPSGAFTNLVEFTNTDSRGVGPYAPLAEGNDGNLYGTTTAGGAFNCGTIFRITPNGSFKVLWNFNNPNKLQQCEHPATGPLLKDKEGNFYGTTKWGGRTDWGTVFKLTLHNSGTQSSAVPTSNSSATASTSDASGAMKIVSQKEQTSKHGSSPSDDETSDVPGLKAAKAEYEASSQDEAARVRYVTKLADMCAQVAPKILHNPDVDAKVAYANQAGAIEEELRKHPMPRNVDSRKLSQLLIGEWESPRHTYVFRADGTYGVADEQRDKWRIDGNEYIDDVSRGPIVLLDHNYFIYACGQGVIIYTRASSASSGNGDKPADSAIKQKVLGYWKFPKAVCYIAAGGKMYVGPRKYATTTDHWNVKDGKFYWDNLPHTIVTLTDKKFYREIGGYGTTFTLIRGTKEEVDPD